MRPAPGCRWRHACVLLEILVFDGEDGVMQNFREIVVVVNDAPL
jgi:hypothetical protein